MFRLVAAAVALLALTGMKGAQSGRGQCPPRGDFQGSMWQDSVATNGCTSAGCQVSGSEFLRWTRQAQAECEGCLVYVGDSTVDFGLPLVNTDPAIPFYRSSVFDLHFSTTPRDQSVSSWLLIMADVRSRVPYGRRGPIFVYDMRWDLVNRWELDQAAPFAYEADWLLRSDRAITNFGSWITSLSGTYSHCSQPHHVDTTEQYDDAAPGGTGCNRLFGDDESLDGEFGIRLYDKLESLEEGLGDAGVYYVSEDESPSFSPYAVVGDLTNEEYQDQKVAECSALIALGFDACDFPHKIHYFCTMNASAPCTAVQFWPVTGDGLGGGNASQGLPITGNLDTLGEINDTIFSGPLETASGTPYIWREYARGMVETQRKNAAVGNPTAVIITPYLWQGCPKDPAAWDSAYNDAACANRWNDSDATACEACTEREIVQNAEYVVIDLGNKPLTHASIGSGGGSGFSFAEIKALLLNPPGGGPAPREVYPYNEYQGGNTNVRGTPERLCGDPGQITHRNPEPRIGLPLLGAVASSPDNVVFASNCPNIAAGDCPLLDTLREGGAEVFGFFRSWEEWQEPFSRYLVRGFAPEIRSITIPMWNLSGMASEVPPECTTWNATGCREAFIEGVADGVREHRDEAAELWIYLGNEQSQYFKDHPYEIADYRAFLVDFCTAIWEAHPRARCGHVLSMRVDDVELLADMHPTSVPNIGIGLNVYAHPDGSFIHGDPDDLVTRLNEAQSVMDAYLPEVWWTVNEIGYTGSTSIGSSAGEQATAMGLARDRLRSGDITAKWATVFTALDGEIGAARCEAAVTALTGLPAGAANLLVQGFICGMGLLETDGSENASFYTWFDVEPPPTEETFFAATPVDTAYVAPAVVHFDATAETVFDEDTFEWDFDDPGSGNWTTGAAALTATPASRNEDRGPIAAHVYESAGTYEPTLLRREADGGTSTATQSFTVVTADSRFSGGSSGETYCFSTSGDFTGCDGRNVTTSDLTAAITDCRDGGGSERRCRFRGGERFVAIFTSTLGSPGTGNLGRIDSYGTGRAIFDIQTVQNHTPPFTPNGAMGFFVTGDRWTFTNVDFTCTSACGSSTGAIQVNSGFSNFTWTNSQVRNMRLRALSTNGSNSTAFSDLVAMVDLDNVLAGSGYCAYAKASRFILLGTICDHDGNQEFNVRTVHNYKTVIAHNHILDAAQTNLNLRAWGGTAGCDTDATVDCDHRTGPVATASEYIVIRDNWLRANNAATPTGGRPFIRLCQNNECANPSGDCGGACPATGSAAEMQYVLIEENFTSWVGSGSSQASYPLVQIQGGDVTVRNNIRDAQGAPMDVDATLVLHQANAATDVTNDDRIVVIGNTEYIDGDPPNVVQCSGGAVGSDHVCQLNLTYAPNQSGGTFADDDGGGWATTTGNDLRDTGDPDPFDNPIPASSDPSDFVLDASSTAKDKGVTPASGTSLNVDFGQNCRPAGASRDAGAWEQGASACP